MTNKAIQRIAGGAESDGHDGQVPAVYLTVTAFIDVIQVTPCGQADGQDGHDGQMFPGFLGLTLAY